MIYTKERVGLNSSPCISTIYLGNMIKQVNKEQIISMVKDENLFLFIK